MGKMRVEMEMEIKIKMEIIMNVNRESVVHRGSDHQKVKFGNLEFSKVGDLKRGPEASSDVVWM